MTNFYKVYITGKNKITRYNHIKKHEEVIKLLIDAKQAGSISYSIVKRTKRGTDVPILSGMFEKDFNIDYIKERLNVDFRIIENEHGGKNLVMIMNKKNNGFEEER